MAGRRRSLAMHTEHGSNTTMSHKASAPLSG